MTDTGFRRTMFFKTCLRYMFASSDLHAEAKRRIDCLLGDWQPLVKRKMCHVTYSGSSKQSRYLTDIDIEIYCKLPSDAPDPAVMAKSAKPYYLAIQNMLRNRFDNETVFHEMECGTDRRFHVDLTVTNDGKVHGMESTERRINEMVADGLLTPGQRDAMLANTGEGTRLRRAVHICSSLSPHFNMKWSYSEALRGTKQLAPGEWVAMRDVMLHRNVWIHVLMMLPSEQVVDVDFVVKFYYQKELQRTMYGMPSMCQSADGDRVSQFVARLFKAQYVKMMKRLGSMYRQTSKPLNDPMKVERLIQRVQAAMDRTPGLLYHVVHQCEVASDLIAGSFAGPWVTRFLRRLANALDRYDPAKSLVRKIRGTKDPDDSEVTRLLKETMDALTIRINHAVFPLLRTTYEDLERFGAKMMTFPFLDMVNREYQRYCAAHPPTQTDRLLAKALLRSTPGPSDPLVSNIIPMRLVKTSILDHLATMMQGWRNHGMVAMANNPNADVDIYTRATSRSTVHVTLTCAVNRSGQRLAAFVALIRRIVLNCGTFDHRFVRLECGLDPNFRYNPGMSSDGAWVAFDHRKMRSSWDRMLKQRRMSKQQHRRLIDACRANATIEQRVQCNDRMNRHRLLVWTRHEVDLWTKQIGRHNSVSLVHAMQDTTTQLWIVLRFGSGMYAETCITCRLVNRNMNTVKVINKMRHLNYNPDDARNHCFCGLYYCFTGRFHSVLRVIRAYYRSNKQRVSDRSARETVRRTVELINRLDSTCVGALHEAVHRCASMVRWIEAAGSMPTDFAAFAARFRPMLRSFDIEQSIESSVDVLAAQERLQVMLNHACYPLILPFYQRLANAAGPMIDGYPEMLVRSYKAYCKEYPVTPAGKRIRTRVFRRVRQW